METDDFLNMSLQTSTWFLLRNIHLKKSSKTSAFCITFTNLDKLKTKRY